MQMSCYSTTVVSLAKFCSDYFNIEMDPIIKFRSNVIMCSCGGGGVQFFLQDYVTVMATSLWLTQYQWCNPVENRKMYHVILQRLIIQPQKHNKSLSIFYGMYCIHNKLNPFQAKLFRGNINMYLHVMSLVHIDMTQLVEILPGVRQGPTYST